MPSYDDFYPDDTGYPGQQPDDEGLAGREAALAAARKRIADAYQQYWKRAATSKEIDSHLNIGQYGYLDSAYLDSRVEFIKTSAPTPATPPTPPGPFDNYTGPTDQESLIRFWQKNTPVTAPDLPGLVKWLAKHGITATIPTRTGGAPSADKIMIGGQTWDIVQDVGGANAAWWYSLETGDGGTPGALPGSGFGDDTRGSLDDTGGRITDIVNTIPQSFYPAPDRFTYPDFVPPEFNAPEFQAPDKFSYPEFVLPTGEEVLAEDPGYGFRRDEGLRSIRNEKSAQGILRGGGTLKALSDWAQGLASQEYGNAAARRFNTWGANRGAAAEDYDRLWRNTIADYTIDYNREADEYDRALSTYGTNAGRAAQGYGFDLDRAAGIGGGRLGATSLAGNLTLGAGNLAQNARNSTFANWLALFNASRPQLPTYSPSSSLTY